MNNVLNDFGKIFIRDVRDRTIEDIDSLISGKYKTQKSINLSNIFSSLDSSSKSFFNEIIPIIVDYCLNNMLEMFEQNEDIELIMKNQDLTSISDGLAGELYTEDGWIQKFSNQRYDT